MVGIPDVSFYDWYFAPVWIVNAINFGNHAYKNFKEIRQGGADAFPAIYWATVSAAAVLLTGVCTADGLEKMLK